jgi:4-amino-4-deoxy-L-arabinose transferase-like glycosyltransferase
MRRLLLMRTLPGLLLVGVLMLSLMLRVWGTGFGLPAYSRYHPDEHALVERAAAILWTGDWNLHRFNYPAFYAYVQAGAYAGYFLWGAAQGRWNELPAYTLPQYYQVGRLTTALFGTLTVLLLYLVGRQISGRRVGLLAASLLGVCYLHVVHSHYATFDVMVGLFALLTLLFSEFLRTHRKTGHYFLAGLFAGLAGATKYNGAVALTIPLFAHLLVTPWGQWGWLSGQLLVMLGGFLLGFFGGNPFALLHMPDFLNGLATVLHHYGTEQPGFEGTGNWRWYVGVFLRSSDRLMVVLGSLGLVGLLRDSWRKGLLVMAYPLTYYVLVSRFVVRFERNMVPVLPFLALGAAWLLVRSAEWLAGRLKGGPRLSLSLASVGLILVLVFPLASSLAFNHAISQTDLRETAGVWVEQHIEPGAKIAIELYSIPFDHARYEVRNVIRISDHDLAWYIHQGFDVLIISDGVWEILRRQPEIYADKIKIYDELVSGSELLQEFVPSPPSIVTDGYPTVAIYHFAPVRIYRLGPR